MQENEFEKQVKEAMEGFKLTPSEPVWNRIEQQLPREKRRRRFIVFFFLFAGLGLSGYFLYNKLNNEGASINNFETVSKKINDAKKLSDTKDHKNAGKEITAEKITPAAEQQLLQKLQVADVTVREQKKSGTSVLTVTNKQQTVAPQSFVTVEKDITVNSFNDKVAVELTKPIAVEPDTQISIKPADENTTAGEIKPADNISNDNSIATTITAAAAIKSDSTKNILSPDTLLTTAAQTNKQAIKINTNKKWQWGITALYGRADVVENLFSLGSNFDKAYDLSAPGSNTGGNASYNFNVSKQVKAKSAFSFGVAVKKQFSARSSFITGIEYTSLNTQIETGIKKDSAAIFYYNNDVTAQRTELSSFYKPGYGNTYTNRYSFIQVPLIYQHQLNRSKKFQVNWSAGLSLSQLLSTNAIVFDYNNQAFYSNNKLFRKTQVDMLAGLNMNFINGKHADINIGPQLEYRFSKLLQNNNYGRQHLISYGLKASVFFKK